MNDENSAPAHADLIRISAIMRQEIRYHWKRAGMPLWQILRLIDTKPDDLTIDVLNGWVACRTTHALPVQWQLVMDAMAGLPDAVKGKKSVKLGYPTHVEGTKRVPVTTEMHAAFLNELKRTGADITIDLADSEYAPLGLNYRTIQILKLNEAKTVRSDYWSFIMKTLGAMPDYR